LSVGDVGDVPQPAGRHHPVHHARGTLMADGLEIELVSGREIKQVVDALRQVDKKAPARVRKEMRTIARSGAKVVKTKARKLPAKGVAGGTQARPHKRRQ